MGVGSVQRNFSGRYTRPVSIAEIRSGLLQVDGAIEGAPDAPGPTHRRARAHHGQRPTSLPATQPTLPQVSSTRVCHAGGELIRGHGCRYDSSMMGHDCSPYFARRGDICVADAPLVFGQTTDLVEVPISWSLDDHPHFEFLRSKGELMPGLANADAVLGNWLTDFEYMRRTTEWGML